MGKHLISVGEIGVKRHLRLVFTAYELVKLFGRLESMGYRLAIYEGLYLRNSQRVRTVAVNLRYGEE